MILYKKLNLHKWYPAKKNSKVLIIYTMLGWKQKKQKHTRNISGLRNQSKASPAPTDSSYNPIQLRSLAPSSEYNGDESKIEEEEDLELLIHFDSLKMNLKYKEEYGNLDENGENEEYIEDWECFNSQEMGCHMHSKETEGSLEHLQESNEGTRGIKSKFN